MEDPRLSIFPRMTSLIVFLPQSFQGRYDRHAPPGFLWDNFKEYNTHTYNVRRGKKENRAKKILKVIMIKSCPKLTLDTYPHSQQTQRTPGKINTEKKIDQKF